MLKSVKIESMLLIVYVSELFLPLKIIFYTRKSSKKYFPNFSCIDKNEISEG
jgi:hypothetical protein